MRPTLQSGWNFHYRSTPKRSECISVKRKKRYDYCVEDDDNIRELVIYTLETTGLKAKGFAEGTAFMEALAFDTPELFYLISCFRVRMGWSF